MKKIKLTQDKYTTVDDCDYVYLMQWKWSLLKTKYHLYAQRRPKINGKYQSVLMHRLIAARASIDCSNKIDHHDRNGLNNQRLNLRSSTTSQNNSNTVKRKRNKSGFKGVYQNKKTKRWIAQINFDKVHKYIGSFATRKQAAIAYNTYCKALHGKFARPNNIKGELTNNRGTWSHNKSGFRGVCWDRTRGKWAVEIMIKKKHIHLGRFDDLIKAAKAYNKEAKKLFGPNAYQNEV